MKTILVLVGLLSVLVYPTTIAIPLNSQSSESIESTEDSEVSTKEASNEASNESIYLVKETSYEIGVVDTIDLGNSSQIVVVSPKDRIETEDLALWTPHNESTLENESTTNAAPTEASLPTTEADLRYASKQVNKDTVSSSDAVATSQPPSNTSEQINKESTNVTTNDTQ